jgi:hypothetical protein
MLVLTESALRSCQATCLCAYVHTYIQVNNKAPAVKVAARMHCGQNSNWNESICCHTYTYCLYTHTIHIHTYIQDNNEARAVKLAARARGTKLELERVAIENFRKLDASIQIRMLEHDSRTHLTSQEAVKAMMEAFIVGCWDQRDRCVCMYVILAYI